MLVFDSFWYRFWKPFWFILGYTFGALGIEEVTNISSKIDAEIGIGKSRFRGRPAAQNSSELVANRGLPLGDRKKRRKEERKTERKEEMTI